MVEEVSVVLVEDVAVGRAERNEVLLVVVPRDDR